MPRNLGEFVESLDHVMGSIKDLENALREAAYHLNTKISVVERDKELWILWDQDEHGNWRLMSRLENEIAKPLIEQKLWIRIALAPHLEKFSAQVDRDIEEFLSVIRLYDAKPAAKFEVQFE